MNHTEDYFEKETEKIKSYIEESGLTKRIIQEEGKPLEELYLSQIDEDLVQGFSIQPETGDCCSMIFRKEASDGTHKMTMLRKLAKVPVQDSPDFYTETVLYPSDLQENPNLEKKIKEQFGLD